MLYMHRALLFCNVIGRRLPSLFPERYRVRPNLSVARQAFGADGKHGTRIARRLAVDAGAGRRGLGALHRGGRRGRLRTRSFGRVLQFQLHYGQLGLGSRSRVSPGRSRARIRRRRPIPNPRVSPGHPETGITSRGRGRGRSRGGRRGATLRSDGRRGLGSGRGVVARVHEPRRRVHPLLGVDV